MDTQSVRYNKCFALRKESLTRQFIPESHGLNRTRNSKKGRAIITRYESRVFAREKGGDARFLNWKRALRKEKCSSSGFYVRRYIPYYRKRGASEPVFALRKASLDILFSDERFNRVAIVSRQRAERTSEVQRPLSLSSYRYSLSFSVSDLSPSPCLDSWPVSGASLNKRSAEGPTFYRAYS